MKNRSTWPLWAGLLVSIGAFFSYFFVFVKFPSTRDFPWATLLLFGLALVLVVAGLRGSFATDAGRGRKIAGSIGALLSILVTAFFLLTFFVGGKQLPASKGSPQVGQKAPDFRLADSNGKSVSLAELLSTPVDGKAPRGVLLIFYRGYW
jgi:hypothetical protein